MTPVADEASPVAFAVIQQEVVVCGHGFGSNHKDKRLAAIHDQQKLAIDTSRIIESGIDVQDASLYIPTIVVEVRADAQVEVLVCRQVRIAVNLILAAIVQLK